MRPCAGRNSGIATGRRTAPISRRRRHCCRVFLVHLAAAARSGFQNRPAATCPDWGTGDHTTRVRFPVDAPSFRSEYELPSDVPTRREPGHQRRSRRVHRYRIVSAPGRRARRFVRRWPARLAHLPARNVCRSPSRGRSKIHPRATGIHPSRNRLRGRRVPGGATGPPHR